MVQIVLVTLLLVVLYVGSASAECAWVLWWEHREAAQTYRKVDSETSLELEREGKTSWNILGSYPHNRDCENQQTLKMGSMLAKWRKERDEAMARATSKDTEHTVSEAGGNVISKRSQYVGDKTYVFSDTFRYLCLPDTVDPRGSKGK